MRSSQDARGEYLELFRSVGITLTALNCNGNPLHPDSEVREKRGEDGRDAIELAALLGVRRVVTTSGPPATDARGTLPAWSVLPWGSADLDSRDYQWNQVAIPYWKDIQARAADADVKVCIEMHPQNVVYNPATMERLAEAIGATHVGAEMDPSHLFWQGIDPIAAIERLGGLVYNAAAMDTRINEAAKVNGVLDDRFGRVAPDAPGVVSLGLATRSACGQRMPRGTSSLSVAATTPSTGAGSSPRSSASTRTWRSTSNTRTRSSTSSKASGTPPTRSCAPPAGRQSHSHGPGDWL
jgi:sugar phosphate isomerase/epimerase